MYLASTGEKTPFISIFNTGHRSLSQRPSGLSLVLAFFLYIYVLWGQHKQSECFLFCFVFSTSEASAFFFFLLFFLVLFCFICVMRPARAKRVFFFSARAKRVLFFFFFFCRQKEFSLFSLSVTTEVEGFLWGQRERSDRWPLTNKIQWGRFLKKSFIFRSPVKMGESTGLSERLRPSLQTFA